MLSEPLIRAEVAGLADLDPAFESKQLRDAMLLNPRVRRRVNRCLHPKIAEMGRSSNAQFVEVPLLIETCQWNGYDQVWLVACGPEEQRRRLVARYGNEELAARLIAVQLPSNVKRCFADAVIRTNQPLECVRFDLDSTLLAL